VAGGFADWEKQRTKRITPVKTAKPNAEAAPAAPPPPPQKTKLSYKDQRDYDLLPAKIEELLTQIARDEAALSDPALYTRDPAKFAALTKAIDAARAEKDAAEERWLELAEQVEG
jgi:ATP-binding cassette subfamily F protein uup